MENILVILLEFHCKSIKYFHSYYRSLVLLLMLILLIRIFHNSMYF